MFYSFWNNTGHQSAAQDGASHLFYGEKNIITRVFLRGVIDLHRKKEITWDWKRT